MKTLATLTLGVVLLSAASAAGMHSNGGVPLSQINGSAPHDSVVYGGLVHIGFSHLFVDPINNTLSVPAEPASGVLGVSTRLGIATAFHQSWLEFFPYNNLAPFLEHVAIAEGNNGIGGEQTLGTSRVSKAGAMLGYSADYSAIGASSYTVEVYSKGKLVASVNGLVNAPFVQTSVWPTDGGVMFVSESGGGKLGERLVPASSWGLQSETPILIVELRAAGGGKGLTGDEIRIIPENTMIAPESITRLTVHGEDIPVLKISDETLEAPPGKRGGDAIAASSPTAVSLSVAPNPAAGGGVRISFRAPSDRSPVSIGVYDAAGRIVRTLSAGIANPGNAEIAWDGEDGAGRPVAAGTYFLRLDAGAASETQRVTIVR
ncbi:MAG: FlgD immunoglobulin-like domain containing protein [bacterium]